MKLCLWLPFLLSFWYYFLDFDHMNIFTDLSVSTYTCESFIYFYYFFKLYSASQMVWPERTKRKEEKALRPMLTLRRSREGKSISSVHSLNHVWLFATPWTAACQASCPSPTPRVHSNPCPLSRWCHPTNSSSVIPFSSCPQSFPASGSFQMSQLFSSSGQSMGVSASASVLQWTPDWFPLGWTGWLYLQSKGLSRVFCNTTVQKHQFFSAQLPL